MMRHLAGAIRGFPPHWNAAPDRKLMYRPFDPVPTFLRRSFTRTLRRKDSTFSANMERYFPNTYGHVTPATPDDIKDQIQQHVHKILLHVKADDQSTEGGLYVGTPGIAFMLYYMAKNSDETQTPDANMRLIKKAIDYLKPAIVPKRKDPGGKDDMSFLLGHAGAVAVAAAAYHDLHDYVIADKYSGHYASLYKRYLVPNFIKCGADELFVGRAGYLAGALWLHRALGRPILPADHMHAICDVIVESGREYAKKHGSLCPLMYAYYKTEYIGAAHGLSFILQMLITVPGYLETSKRNADDIHSTIEYILSLQLSGGNWPCAMDEVGDHPLVHWCHGAPGVVYLMARAYVVYNDKRFLQSCVKAADLTWQRGLLRKGPGICHGVAGNAYVFLLLYRLTKEEKYLMWAHSFTDFMQSELFIAQARVPDNRYSLYEGTAGTVVFLTDLLAPDKAEFPFQDVFTNYATIK